MAYLLVDALADLIQFFGRLLWLLVRGMFAVSCALARGTYWLLVQGYRWWRRRRDQAQA